MIAIPQPAMALNAAAAPGSYEMHNSMTVDTNYDPDALMGWVADVAKGAPGGRLRALVIRSHGACGYIALGNGIKAAQAKAFAKINGLVDDIFVVGCRVAGTEKRSRGYVEGMTLCFELAKQSGAFVFASSANQAIDEKLRQRGESPPNPPFGYIDDFEKPAFVFHPDGSTKEDWNGKLPFAKKAWPKKPAP
jgi:hypothetical protein